MADTLTKAERSERMKRVRDCNTKPELAVRRLTHAMGYRYRLHQRDLPGKPDMVFPGRKKVIFVHGCFWHGHSCKHGDRRPATNIGYWEKKIARNVERYSTQVESLKGGGWSVLTVWECEMADVLELKRRLRRFLLQLDTITPNATGASTTTHGDQRTENYVEQSRHPDRTEVLCQ